MKNLISLCIVALLSTNILFAQATDDNEIKIDQEGDTLKLYIDQIGFGNKIGGDDASSGSPSNMAITGSGLEFDLDFTGNSNLDLPIRLFNSTTVNNPETSLPILFTKFATQSTVPPVAKRSSTIAYELNFFIAFFWIVRVFFPYSKL